MANQRRFLKPTCRIHTRTCRKLTNTICVPELQFSQRQRTMKLKVKSFFFQPKGVIPSSFKKVGNWLSENQRSFAESFQESGTTSVPPCRSRKRKLGICILGCEEKLVLGIRNGTQRTWMSRDGSEDQWLGSMGYNLLVNGID